MKKNVSTILMTATLATVIGLGGAVCVNQMTANPTVAYADELDDLLNNKEQIALDNLMGQNPDLSGDILKYYRKYGVLPDVNSAQFKQYVEDVEKSYGEIPTTTPTEETTLAEDVKPADIETPWVDVAVPEKDTNTPAVDVKPEPVAPKKDADVETKDEAVGTEVKTEEKKDTSDQVNSEAISAEKTVNPMTSNEPKHTKKSAIPNTADVTAGVAAYLLGGLGLGLVSRKKK